MAATSARAKELLALVALVTDASQIMIQEWAKEDSSVKAGEQDTFSSAALRNAQRTIISTCGSFTELAQVPQKRLIEVATEFSEARALHVVAEHRIADHLSAVDQKLGMPISELSKETGLHPQKLSRIMRNLCSAHIFAEVREGCFSNNTVSAALVNNEYLRAYILVVSRESYSASVKLPQVLADPVKGWSTSATCTPFQVAFGTDLAQWEWLEEGEVQPDGTVKPRPSLELFGLAMAGGDRILGTPPSYDFPWESLGSGTLVDVGGGVGGMCMDLCKQYPLLNFVVQDRAPVIEQAYSLWEDEQPEAFKSGRVKLMPHNLFTENPVVGADAYVLRHIIHDWEDNRCVDILSALRPALSERSRVLIVDKVLNTTLGCPELPSAPFPLLANYGNFARAAHELDLLMMTLFNGAERTPAEFRVLAEKAGLVVTRIWECPGMDYITEMRLPSASQ
ncbi:O-methyltransferase gedA [Sparassis crispa]|uniref:O-methyltransferase gedA n=1 Tax=Sparassis crispa TaxID=139825 RepID=A0A401GPR7_9APHY|nr:O-methyltransferase gedA [Sparassis crispa]GBE84213.1 O-methyltransferase gedA [Sparassis crispa]